ncbi:GIY-YIG nuclease family protein [Pseudomonas capsici]|uniref:GIY-YIG nuclease family protein n=1 Tax=Pseudomonas capsici TaxID=2810614 RepID=UPI000E3CDD8B|nr:GIY-YIG nuclease family protein [Pseudomonas capsici]MCV4282870.1 GIY-YIG nuclease family protein [Pseudomonas capsici]
MPDAMNAAIDVTAPVDKPWFVYLVRAANGSLYCGISDDPYRRFADHQSGKGARFFHSSPAVALVYVEVWDSKGEALRQERLIKKLRKSAKEVLAASYAGSPITQRDAVSSA